MRPAQQSVTIALGTLALFVAIPGAVTAQALPGPRAGLSQVAPPNLADTRLPRIADDNRFGHWQKGAIIGGLIGAALAVMINEARYDIASDHKSLRVLEFTFGGAIIGGLIAAK
ncbi:MAG TPA: hypothetical protein VGL65_14080 [Gemmatimonadales bacterium]|jgi:hypothetical protein